MAFTEQRDSSGSVLIREEYVNSKILVPYKFHIITVFLYLYHPEIHINLFYTIYKNKYKKIYLYIKIVMIE